jgi:hypothetical protein
MHNRHTNEIGVHKHFIIQVLGELLVMRLLWLKPPCCHDQTEQAVSQVDCQSYMLACSAATLRALTVNTGPQSPAVMLMCQVRPFTVLVAR